MLLLGFPVAFTFGAVAVIFGFIYGLSEAWDYAQGFEILTEAFEDMSRQFFSLMPNRIYSIMENQLLISVPLFILMGMILQKTRLAERLLESMAFLFGGVRGGVAISTVLVGALLAATTGIVGATVIAMGVISLPVMMKYGYDKPLATGTIAAAGTLGQIIPPSIVLIILGDILSVSVGDLFSAAVIPGLVLVGFYVIYIAIISYICKDYAPPVPPLEGLSKSKQIFIALKIATPTESSSVGCLGAIALAVLYRTFSFRLIYDALKNTAKISGMVFMILMGATAFSMIFSYTGGDEVVKNFMENLPGQAWGFIALTMVVIIVLGFFLDYVEISYIILPILLPIVESLHINPVWFAILIAVNLQTSFMTPPFGFSIFFLKGVTPPQIHTTDIYKGVLPFILLQILVLLTLAIFPGVFGLKAFLG